MNRKHDYCRHLSHMKTYIFECPVDYGIRISILYYTGTDINPRYQSHAQIVYTHRADLIAQYQFYSAYSVFSLTLLSVYIRCLLITRSNGLIQFWFTPGHMCIQGKLTPSRNCVVNFQLFDISDLMSRCLHLCLCLFQLLCDS